MSHMKKAAGVLIIRKSDGKVLTASRRNKPESIGIPGGKVDPGETVLEAVIRETFEETGIQIHPKEIELVYRNPCRGEIDYDTSTYFCFAEDLGSRAKFDKPYECEKGIQIRWATWEELKNPNTSNFASYNTGLYEQVKSKLRNNDG